MIQRITFLVLAIFLASLPPMAQEDTKPGVAFYVELAGKGFFSGNVDFPIGSNGRLTLGLTMLDHEFAKEDEADEEYPVQTLPTPSLMYFGLFGSDKHYFEAGIGLSVSPVPWKEYSENDSVLSLHGSLGYRYQKPDAFFFRAGFTPFYRINWAFLPLVGVSFGYSW